ncbi:hypothetical protein ACHAPQ_005088 [Fusarium lateritium]
MEVLGAIASSIAVIQALAAGKHVVSLIRQMPDIQKDFEYLMKELGLIRSMVQAVRRMSPTAFEQDLIHDASGNLEEVTRELEALLRKCAYEDNQGDKKVWKTKKRKWLIEKSDIQKLQQRMGQAKETLHFAVTSSQTSLNSRRASIDATYALRNLDLDEHQTYLIQRILSYARDDSECVTTKVHAAIDQCAGLGEALREQPWAIDAVDECGYSPLQLATFKRRVPDMEVLISAGANVNQQMYHGHSALMLAACSGNPEAVTTLLTAKCSVNLVDSEGETALYFALNGGNLEVMRLLLASGASATHRDMLNRTPLHRLGYNMEADYNVIKPVVDMLITTGADLEAKDSGGITPIACAIVGNSVDAARCLVEAGCSLSSYSFTSKNLLHLASLYASLDMLEYLCGLGLSDISPYHKNSRGLTPWDMFLKTHVADEWGLRGRRKPNLAEQDAFVELFQGVRDRYLQHDICILKQIFSALQKQDVTSAREDLALLIERERNWECYDRAAWYRAVEKRVEYLEWDLAIEDVEGCLVDMKKELDTPVWKIPSKWGHYLWGDDDGDWITEEEWVESEWSTEEDLAEDEYPEFQD